MPPRSGKSLTKGGWRAMALSILLHSAIVAAAVYGWFTWKHRPRNLKTFNVDVNISKELAKLIPSSRVSISESGLGDVPTILELRKYGYKGFLIGEQFMRQSRPEDACKEFIDQIKITSRVPGTL
jgi:hypothetical protein